MKSVSGYGINEFRKREGGREKTWGPMEERRDIDFSEKVSGGAVLTTQPLQKGFDQFEF